MNRRERRRRQPSGGARFALACDSILLWRKPQMRPSARAGSRAVHFRRLGSAAVPARSFPAAMGSPSCRSPQELISAPSVPETITASHRRPPPPSHRQGADRSPCETFRKRNSPWLFWDRAPIWTLPTGRRPDDAAESAPIRRPGVRRGERPGATRPRRRRCAAATPYESPSTGRFASGRTGTANQRSSLRSRIGARWSARRSRPLCVRCGVRR